MIIAANKLSDECWVPKNIQVYVASDVIALYNRQT